MLVPRCPVVTSVEIRKGLNVSSLDSICLFCLYTLAKEPSKFCLTNFTNQPESSLDRCFIGIIFTKSVSLISRSLIRAALDKHPVELAQNIQNIATSGNVHFCRIFSKRSFTASICPVKMSVQTLAQSSKRFGFRMKKRMSPRRNCISSPEILDWPVPVFRMRFMR